MKFSPYASDFYHAYSETRSNFYFFTFLLTSKRWFQQTAVLAKIESMKARNENKLN